MYTHVRNKGFMPFGRVIYDKENVYLNGSRIDGINNFEAQVGFSKTPISVMGIGYIGQSIEGDIPKSFSFKRILGDSEASLINLVGADLTGLYRYQSSERDHQKEWKALLSRISSYEMNCSVGEIPESTYSFEVVGDAGFNNIQTPETGDTNQDLTIVRPGDLVFSGDDHFSTNRLQSFKYSFNIPYQKVNTIGDMFASTFSLNDPIEISLEMEFELDGAEDDLSSIPLCEKNFNGIFMFNKCEELVRTFSVSGAELMETSLNGTVGSNATFSCVYKSYVNSFTELKNLSLTRVNIPSSSSSSKSSSSSSESSLSSSSSSVSSSSSSSSRSSSSRSSSSSSRSSSSSSYDSSSSGTELSSYSVIFTTPTEDPINYDSEPKGTYEGAEINLNGKTWYFSNALLGSLASDKRIEPKSVRIKRDDADPLISTEGEMRMMENFTNGMSYLEFYYAAFGTDTNQPQLRIQYSTDDGGTWRNIGTTISTFPSTMTLWSATANINGKVIIKITTSGTFLNNGRRINIDHFKLIGTS